MTQASTSTRMAGWLEQAWLARYLDGELSDSEREWFEAYVLDKPELLAVVDDDSNLRDALAATADARRILLDADSADNPAPTRDHRRDASIHRSGNDRGGMARRDRSRRLGWLGMAAAVVAGIGVGVAMLGRWSPDVPGSVVENPTRIVYDTMRGEPTSPRVEHGKSGSSYVLVEIAVPIGVTAATLHVDGERDLELSTSPDGFVSVLLRRKLIEQRKSVVLTYATTDRQETRSISFDDIDGR